MHGDAGLDAALKATEALRPGSKTKLDDASTLLMLLDDLPNVTLPR